MTRDDLLQKLASLAEPDYRRFSLGLLPGVYELAGVRLPQLRRLARAIARENGRDYQRILGGGTFEEQMLQGMVIGALGLEIAPLLEEVGGFVPKIDNWSVCDSFCAGLRFREADAARVFDFLPPYLTDDREFFARFGAVMLLERFIDEAHIDEVLARLTAVRCQAHCARMAVAWALSVAFVQFPAQTREVLRGDALDEVTRAKAIQKIIESRRVDALAKEELRALRRRSGAT